MLKLALSIPAAIRVVCFYSFLSLIQVTDRERDYLCCEKTSSLMPINSAAGWFIIGSHSNGATVVARVADYHIAKYCSSK